MSETNIITVKMYGVEATGTPEKIAELKKLLDEQNPIKVKLIPQTQPYPWQPYIYPQYPYFGKTTITTGTPLWKDNSITCNSLSTSNDANCIASNGSLIHNTYLTN